MKFLKKFITIGMLAALAVGSVACSQDVKLDIDNMKRSRNWRSAQILSKAQQDISIWL